MVESNLDKTIKIIDETGAEIGEVNRVQFILDNFTPFNITPPAIINDTVTTAEIERFHSEIEQRLVPIAKAITDFATESVKQMGLALTPVFKWLEAHPEFSNLNSEQPHVSRYRLTRTPRT